MASQKNEVTHKVRWLDKDGWHEVNTDFQTACSLYDALSGSPAVKTVTRTSV